MSLHHSGKMLLALYNNGVLRLWNMQTARCTFKKKVGLIEEGEPSEKSEDDDEEEPVKVTAKKDLDDYDRKPIQV